jgi:hypothetical protein
VELKERPKWHRCASRLRTPGTRQGARTAPCCPRSLPAPTTNHVPVVGWVGGPKSRRSAREGELVCSIACNVGVAGDRACSGDWVGHPVLHFSSGGGFVSPRRSERTSSGFPILLRGWKLKRNYESLDFFA